MPTTVNITNYTNNLTATNIATLQIDAHTTHGNTHTLHTTPNTPHTPTGAALTQGDFTRIQIAGKPPIYATHTPNPNPNTIEYKELTEDATAITRAVLDTPPQHHINDIAELINTGIQAGAAPAPTEVHIDARGPVIGQHDLRDTNPIAYSVKPETGDMWALLTVTYPIGELTVDTEGLEAHTARGGEIEFDNGNTFKNMQENPALGMDLNRRPTDEEFAALRSRMFTTAECASFAAIKN